MFYIAITGRDRSIRLPENFSQRFARRRDYNSAQSFASNSLEGTPDAEQFARTPQRNSPHGNE
jgi:hypothetical protein